MGPYPMQLVVVMAVRKAVSAATITFTATSTIFPFFMILHSSLFTLHFLIAVAVAGHFAAASGVTTRVAAGITASVVASGVSTGS